MLGPAIVESIVSVPLVDSSVPELVIVALLIALVPIEFSVPALLTAPPLMMALTRSTVEPRSSDTVPPVLVTVSVVSVSVELSIACNRLLLVIGSLVISSAPPLASSLPVLLILGPAIVGSIVPLVDSSVPELVIVALLIALVPVEFSVPALLTVPPLMVALLSVSPALSST